MKKKFCLLFFLFLLFIFFFPKEYSSYSFKENAPEKEKEWLMELEVPPLDGCFTACWGFLANKRCSEYLRQYDKCTATCYGFAYNNCLGFSSSLLSKFFPSQ